MRDLSVSLTALPHMRRVVATIRSDFDDGYIDNGGAAAMRDLVRMSAEKVVDVVVEYMLQL